MTFRPGADVNMDVGVSGFGPESTLGRSVAMVSVLSKCPFEACHFYCFIKETPFVKNKINLERNELEYASHNKVFTV